jgi:hypothetical protein
MLSNFQNFDKINGQVLALSGNRPIKAPIDGLIFYAIISRQGRMVYFIANKSKFWLKLSVLLRKLSGIRFRDTTWN